MDFSNISVLCIGDVMLDRFIYSDMQRISQEAPVPVLRLNRTHEMLGGAGNVVNNIASLGGRAVLIGLIGQDHPGVRLRHILDTVRGVECACIETSNRPTICKTRFIAAHQQVVRADEESLEPLGEWEEAALLSAVRAHIGNAQAVVLADYGKGVLDAKTTALIIRYAHEARVPVFVDPKSPDFLRYRGATCITPNLKELAAASKMPVNSQEAVIAAARRVMTEADAQAILATRSELGMMLIEASGEVHSVAAHAREVFDVSGAGDTVIATMALCHAAGRSLQQSMHVANAAASVVVSKRGTATADMTEVMNAFDVQDQKQHDSTTKPLSHVRALAARWKAQGLVVGFTDGCFDILNPSHITLLARAREQCDRLIVALNTDSSARRLRGSRRPVNSLEARARVVAAIRYVDCITSFEEDTPLELLRAVMPDVLIKRGDNRWNPSLDTDFVRTTGARVVIDGRALGQSATTLHPTSQRLEPVI